MSAFYAEDFDRQFHLALILASFEAPSLWKPDRWPDLANSLEQLVIAARGEPMAEWAYTERFGNKFRFVECTSRRWRDSPSSQGVFEIWNLLAPTNRVCAREQRCPDLYVSISNLLALPNSRGRFSASVLLAFGADLPFAEALLDAATERLASSVSASMIARTRRSWGFPNETGYNGGISETQWLVGSLLDREPGGDILRENWEKIVIPELPK